MARTYKRIKSDTARSVQSRLMKGAEIDYSEDYKLWLMVDPQARESWIEWQNSNTLKLLKGVMRGLPIGQLATFSGFTEGGAHKAMVRLGVHALWRERRRVAKATPITKPVPPAEESRP